MRSLAGIWVQNARLYSTSGNEGRKRARWLTLAFWKKTRPEPPVLKAAPVLARPQDSLPRS